MGAETKIEWAHHTFNPWWGCSKISLGCANCYAEALDKRTGGAHWGPKADRRRTGHDNWKLPLRWNRKAAAEGKRYRVFCASMADVFDDHPSILPEWREDLWALIEATPHLDWLLLTKRPENIMGMIPDRWRERLPDHVAVGTSIVNQAEADTKIDLLKLVPARVRFLSMEPLLGPVVLKPEWRALLEWVIVGGESGPGARPMHPDWVRSIRDQCAAAGVAFFFKQWGEWAPQIGAVDGWEIDDNPEVSRFDHLEWDDAEQSWGKPFRPLWCDFQDGNCDELHTVSRIGKRRAGRLLDGITHDAFPGGAA